jgi:hypothetical protein
LKELAVDYLHPELPVQTTDPFACGRNYFTRPSSAPTQEEDVEDEEERSRILEEMQQMKKLAVDYLHPERPVQTTDPFACGRNYFTRPSAPPQEDMEDEEERSHILELMQQMKKLAVDYLHPERPVQTTDPLACGRNYFARPSAPKVNDEEEEEERERILKELEQLKKLAVDYLHPEKPIETTDTCACGRNYFTRPSAPGLVDQTHTYCEYVDHGFHHVLDHDHHYYWYNKEEETPTSRTEEDDHQFEMDDMTEEEEPFYEFKAKTLEVEPFKGEHAIDFVMKDSISMSRSPQSILMLT